MKINGIKEAKEYCINDIRKSKRSLENDLEYNTYTHIIIKIYDRIERINIIVSKLTRDFSYTLEDYIYNMYLAQGLSVLRLNTREAEKFAHKHSITIDIDE